MASIDQDLFGDDVVVNTRSERDLTPLNSDNFIEHDGESNADDLFGDEADTQSGAQDTTEATSEVKTSFIIANFKQPQGDNGDIFLAKLPSFLDVDPYAFDADTLLAEIQQTADATVDNDEKMTKKRSLVNTLRWRTGLDGDGRETRLANGRFVKWNDGTMSLQIGDELFDVPIKNVEKDHTYLTMMHAEEGLLRGMQRFVYSMSFQPYGLSSKSHAELKADIARRAITSKGRTVKLHTEMIDPAEIQKQAIKADNERQKARRRLDNQKAKTLNYSNAGRDRTQLTARYLDDSDDETGPASGQRYADDNDDGFVVDDENSDLDDDTGGSRLQALKEAGAAVYKDRSNKRGHSDSNTDSDLDSILDDQRDERANEPQDTKPRGADSQDEQSRVKKLKRRIADSDDDEE